jgi:arginine:agmatine antiporter
MRRPVRNAPIATLGGLVIAASVYLAATTVIMGIMPAAELASSNAPFADAALPLLGVAIAGPVALCAMLKAAGTLSATGLATLESIDNEAVLGQLPRAGARLQTARMRARILIVTGLIVTLMVVGSASPTLGRSFAILADITVVLTLLVYLVACLALFKTSARARGRNRLWARLLAVTGAVFCCGLIASSEFDLLVWSGIAVAVALAAHQVLRRFQPSPADVG